MHVHLIGIGGSGLSAIARLLLESGYQVSGSDRRVSPTLEHLRRAGAQVYLGHSRDQIAGADLVVRSSAVPDDNVEVQAAYERGIPVLKRADFLGQLMADRLGIAVAGTHGKTTTTAMIAWTLVRLGQDPSFIVGGVLNDLGTNARAGPPWPRRHTGSRTPGLWALCAARPTAGGAPPCPGRPGCRRGCGDAGS